VLTPSARHVARWGPATNGARHCVCQAPGIAQAATPDRRPRPITDHRKQVHRADQLVQIDLGDDDHDHVIAAEDKWNLARQ
jgi:hypothetical protein